MRAVKLYILCIIFKTLIYIKEKEALRTDLQIGSTIGKIHVLVIGIWSFSHQNGVLNPQVDCKLVINGLI